MGPSGCGKSTILKAIIAAVLNLTEPGLPSYEGQIYIEPNVAVSYVPQESELASWLNVRDNILLPISIKGQRNSEAESFVEKLMKTLSLLPWKYTMASELSRGTARRVALARALALRPKVLLLDEPFAGLDFDLREDAVALLQDCCQQSLATMVIVTHEPYEAASIAKTVHMLGRKSDSRCVAIRREEHESVSTFQHRILCSALQTAKGAH